MVLFCELSIEAISKLLCQLTISTISSLILHLRKGHTVHWAQGPLMGAMLYIEVIYKNINKIRLCSKGSISLNRNDNSMEKALQTYSMERYKVKAQTWGTYLTIPQQEIETTDNSMPGSKEKAQN